MKKSMIALAAALAAVFATGVSAQSTGPGQDKSVPSAPATAEQKAAAKEARKAEGKKVAKTATMADDTPASAGKAKAATKTERKAAAAKRKAEGAEATKEPKNPG